jgi:hypothetical protein
MVIYKVCRSSGLGRRSSELSFGIKPSVLTPKKPGTAKRKTETCMNPPCGGDLSIFESKIGEIEQGMGAVAKAEGVVAIVSREMIKIMIQMAEGEW